MLNSTQCLRVQITIFLGRYRNICNRFVRQRTSSSQTMRDSIGEVVRLALPLHTTSEILQSGSDLDSHSSATADVSPEVK